MKVITEFVQSIDLYGGSRVLREVNKYHIGKEGISTLEEQWPKGKNGIDMQSVHHKLYSTYRIDVIVEVLEDGSLRLKGQKND